MKRILLIAMLTMVTLALQAQDTTVRGTVVDNHNEPMPGVTIEIVGRPETTTTDIDGRFVIHLAEPAKKVKAKYPGYSSKDKKITDNMVIVMFPRKIRVYFDLQGGIGFGSKKNINAGSTLITDLKNPISFGVNATIAYQLNSNLSLGLGYGITCNQKEYKAIVQPGIKTSKKFIDVLGIPIFAEARWCFEPHKKASPFVYLKAGYQFTKSDFLISIHNDAPGEGVSLGCYSGKGLFLQPAVGYRVFFRNNTAVNFGLAYSVIDPRKIEAHYKNKTIDIGSIKGGALLLNIGLEFR